MNITDKIKKNIEANTVKNGTVITFVSGGKYTYAAVAVKGSWYITSATSADYRSYFGKSVFSNTEMMEILSRSGVSKVKVATKWSKAKK